MYLVWKRLQSLYRTQKALFLLLVGCPVLCTFFILVSVGSILNVAMTRSENEENLYVMFNLEEDQRFDLAEELAWDCYSREPEVIQYVDFLSPANAVNTLEDGSCTGYVPVVLNAAFQNGNLIPYTDDYVADPIEGVMFDEESFASDTPYALVQCIDTDTVTLDTVTLTVLGRLPWYSDDGAVFPWISVNPAGMESLPISALTFLLTRSLTKEEFSAFCACLDDRGLSYGVVQTGESNADLAAIGNTTAAICGAFLVCFGMTLLLLYGYSLKRRNHQVAVFRMVGCTRNRTIKGYLLEYGILFLPGAIVGGGLYWVFVTVYLGNVQTYLTTGYAAGILWKAFLAEILVVTAELLGSSVFYGRVSVHRQWTVGTR